MPARVPADVKEAVLKSVDDAVAAGLAHTWVCGLWQVSDSRLHRWRVRRRDTGTLVDRAPGGHPVHALLSEEIAAILDGSNVETLVQTGVGEDRHDETNWCVGVAVDHVGGHLYWTQKGPSDAGLGRILRAGIDIPAGESAAHRGDIEVVFKDLPEPIDLEIEHATRMLYWTDRGDPPNGNTVNRAPLDAISYAEPEIVATHLMEGIGIALDPAHNRMFVTDLGGNIWVAAVDGSGHRPIRALQGNLTGIAYAEIPSAGPS